MNGEIAQAVALACHVNAAVAGIRFERFLPNHFTTKFCEWVEFGSVVEGPDGKPRFETLVPDPDQWFEWLREHDCAGAWLAWEPENPSIAPDRMLAGFVGGGGTWQIKTPIDAGTVSWVGGWRLGNKEAEDRRIWQVGYARTGSPSDSSRPIPSFERAKVELVDALTDIHRFATREKCDPFTGIFASALESLRGDPRRRGQHELAPAELLTDDEQRVLDGCQGAWVFGGMGSWNDQGFDAKVTPEYDRVSERLFQAINAAIPAVTTGFILRRP